MKARQAANKEKQSKRNVIKRRRSLPKEFRYIPRISKHDSMDMISLIHDDEFLEQRKSLDRDRDAQESSLCPEAWKKSDPVIEVERHAFNELSPDECATTSDDLFKSLNSRGSFVSLRIYVDKSQGISRAGRSTSLQNFPMNKSKCVYKSLPAVTDRDSR